MPEIVTIPIYSNYYINESKNLTQEQIDNIIFPVVLSPLKQEFKYWHDKLSHLHPKSLFRLEIFGVLQSKFIDLKNYVPLYAPFMFKTARIRK